MAKALVGNAADAQQVHGAKRVETLRAERDANDLRVVMSTVAGRRFVRRLIADICGRDRVVYFEGIAALDLGFAEGARNVGRRVLHEVLSACADQWAQAEQEYIERTKREEGDK